MTRRLNPSVASLIAIAVALWAHPRHIRAAATAFRFNLEPGVASLRPPGSQRSWGILGGFSLGLRVTDLAGLQLHADLKRFTAGEDTDAQSVLALGVAVTYRLDITRLTPAFELGVARVAIVTRGGAGSAEVVGQLGAGVDFSIMPWLLAGVMFRYYPLLSTDLLSPAYSAINARIGVQLGG